VLTIAENKYSLYRIAAVLVLSSCLLNYLNEAVFTVLNVQCALKGQKEKANSNPIIRNRM
jgi:hypothetical protein